MTFNFTNIAFLLRISDYLSHLPGQIIQNPFKMGTIGNRNAAPHSKHTLWAFLVRANCTLPGWIGEPPCFSSCPPWGAPHTSKQMKGLLQKNPSWRYLEIPPALGNRNWKA